MEVRAALRLWGLQKGFCFRDRFGFMFKDALSEALRRLQGGFKEDWKLWKAWDGCRAGRLGRLRLLGVI